MSRIQVNQVGEVTVILLDRPSVRNAVDRETAYALRDAFQAFEDSDGQRVAVLGAVGTSFCAGYDLQSLPEQATVEEVRAWVEGPHGPMGPTRMELRKPVIAAIEGHCVAGGLELALWCDLRVAGRGAQFGVLCRRWGVPLIDGGTVRLPRIVGEGRAMDMVITGRTVDAEEAFEWGLINRLVPSGDALAVAHAWAADIAKLPPICLQVDRHSLRSQWAHAVPEALVEEARGGVSALLQEGIAGASRFRAGAGRHGAPDADASEQSSTNCT